MGQEKTAPVHLRNDTATWWEQVVNGYELEPHHVRLLTLAAETWDRCQQAREAIDKHGMTFSDRFDQPRPRPEVAVERDSRIAFARLLRELALDAPAVDEVRPPRIGIAK